MELARIAKARLPKRIVISGYRTNMTAASKDIPAGFGKKLGYLQDSGE